MNQYQAFNCPSTEKYGKSSDNNFEKSSEKEQINSVKSRDSRAFPSTKFITMICLK